MAAQQLVDQHLRHDERSIDACELPAAVTIDMEQGRASESLPAIEGENAQRRPRSQRGKRSGSLRAGGACPQAALGEQPQRAQLDALVLCASLRHERVQEIQVANQEQPHRRTPSPSCRLTPCTPAHP